MGTCLDRGNAPADMFGTIVNSRSMLRSTVVAINKVWSSTSMAKFFDEELSCDLPNIRVFSSSLRKKVQAFVSIIMY